MKSLGISKIMTGTQRALLGLAVCWGLVSLGQAEEAQEAVHVTVRPLADLLLYPRYSVPASVVSLHDSRLAAETSGRVAEVAVRVGERLAAGDLVLRLDCRDNQLALAQQEAALRSAEARHLLASRQLERVRSLAEDRNVSRELLNQSEYELSAAQAGLAGARLAVDSQRLAVSRCEVLAPFAGVVVERLVSEGEWLAMGQPLLRLVDDQRLEVSARLPIERLDTVTEATTLTLKVGDTDYDVRLERLVAVIDPQGRGREGRFGFSGATSLPGAAGRLWWQASKPHIAPDWLVARDAGLGIFVLEAERARFHPLKGALEGQPAPLGNLDLNMQVIHAGREALQDGAAVILDPETAPEPPPTQPR